MEFNDIFDSVLTWKATWRRLFDASLVDSIHLSKRLNFPVPECKVMWATGDAVLGRFSATNGATQEYIVEDIMGYLDDINLKRRRAIISDVHQLTATSIIATWGESEAILLLGTETHNVLACANHGFAKR